ncbi:FCD domain-containing protein, partial [Streptomyces sp. NPDC050704]|uniref:FCD domain-containing protein n=1 Tax=Streptomyces sp. NPDC050704 TaxID=3157219 RepID=UPI0034311ED2
ATSRTRSSRKVWPSTRCSPAVCTVTRQWGEEALTAHRAFHQALYRASHNDVLIRLLDDLWDKSDRYRRLGLELPPGDEPRTRDLQEHHQLVSLIVDGRAAEAAQLMRGHITHSLTATAISALEDREGMRAGQSVGRPVPPVLP